MSMTSMKLYCIHDVSHTLSLNMVKKQNYLISTKTVNCIFEHFFKTSFIDKYQNWQSFFKHVIKLDFQISTKSDKHFFTSFAARDKTHTMLHKLWQNAQLDQVQFFNIVAKWIFKQVIFAPCCLKFGLNTQLDR